MTNSVNPPDIAKYPNSTKSPEQYLAEIDTLKARIKALENKESNRIEANLTEASETNDYFKGVIQNSRDMLYHMIIPEGEYKYVSSSALQIFGYPAEDFIKNPLLIKTIIHPDWQEYFLEQWKLLLQGECPAEYEYQIIHGQSGEVRWLNQRNAPIFDENEKIIALEGSVTDITENKENASKLTFSEERYRSLYDNSPDMLGSVSADTAELLFCNKTLLDKTGYEMDELVGKPIFDLYHEDCHAVVKEAFIKFVEEGMVKDKELILKRKDGSKLFVLLNVNSIKNKEGKVLYSTSIWHDITNEKEVAERLVNSENRFSKLMQQSPSVIEIYDLDGLQIKVNRAYEELWGFPASHTVESFNLFNSKEVSKSGLIDYVKRAYKGESVLVPEYKFDPTGTTEAHGIGRVRWLSTKIFPLRDEKGEVTNIVISHEDVTDRKEVENKLSQLMNFYEEIIENVQDGIWVSDKNDNIFYVNKGMELIMGAPKELILNKNVLKDFEAGKTEKFSKFYLKAKRLLEPTWYEVQVTTPVGRISWQNGWLIPKLKDGKFAGIICTIRDITERRNAENELTASETKLRAIVDNSMEGIMVLQDGKKKFVNTRLLDVIGYTEEEYDEIELLGLIHPDDVPFIRERYIKVSNGEKIAKSLEFRLLIKTKETKWFSASISKIPWENKDALLLFFTDITEKKRSSIELQKSEEQFKLAMQATKDGLFDWNVLTNEVYYSPGWKSMLGYDYDEIPNDLSTWERLTKPEDVERTWTFLNEIIKGIRSKFKVEFKMKHKSGHWVDIMVRADAFFKDGNAVRVIGTHVDISKIKKAELELKRYQDHLEDLVAERTAELEFKNSELKRFNQLFVGREFRIKELRDKIKKLETQIDPNNAELF